MGRHETTSPDNPVNKKAIELYQNGATVKETAKAVNLSYGGLRYRFSVMGIKMRGIRRISPETVEQIRQERRSGKSYMQISRDCKVGYDTAVKYAKDIKLRLEHRGRMRSITPDDPITQKAAELYREGSSVADAAASVHLSRDGLRHRFKVLGIPIRKEGRGRKLSPERIEDIRREYKSGKSLRKIAGELGLSLPTIRKYAK